MPDEIRIESLVPQPLPDLRRVSLTLRVSGLPAYAYGGGAFADPFADEIAPDDEEQLEKAAAAPVVSNVDLFLETPPPNGPLTGDNSPPGDERPPSPYPDVTLSILDRQGNEVSSTLVIEHKEPDLEFTLHLRAFEPGATYVACAEMTLDEKVIQIVEVPFELR